MSGEYGGAVAVILAVIGLAGGAFGKTLLDRWFDRDRRLDERAGTVETRVFADNEQARVWLREQLADAERELAKVRESEREMLKQVGELAAQVARQEERTNAQTVRIDDLTRMVERLGADYADMKSERDQYRLGKHEAENKLTAESLGRQLAERDLAARNQEIERLRGQLSALQPRDVQKE